MVVTYPPVFAERMDRFPEVAHDRLVVVVNQMAERDRAGADVAYDPARVRENLVALLGSEGGLGADLRAGAGADGGRSPLSAARPRHLDPADRHPGLGRRIRRAGAAGRARGRCSAGTGATIR